MRTTKIIIAALFLMSPLVANAGVISTTTGDYDVTTVAGSFSELAPVLMSQVWWGDPILASEFAELPPKVHRRHFCWKCWPRFHSRGLHRLLARPD